MAKQTTMTAPASIEWTAFYPGGHAKDPGYRQTLGKLNGRVYVWISARDGSRPGSIHMRLAGGNDDDFRTRLLTDAQKAKVADALEAALKAHLAAYAAER